jgi:outer membrane protein OmpA-like peptidoglycan-associated protein
MEWIGSGSSEPRFHNDTPRKWALNRRVDVVIQPGR